MTDGSKRRAEAVGRLESMDGWCEGPITAPDYMRALLWDLNVIDDEHIRAALIELLTDTDAPATDAEAPITDNVRECPQCDPVELMREAREDPMPFTRLRKALGIDHRYTGSAECLHILADMVERDYVRREDHEDAVTALMAERDEAVRALDEYIEAHDAWHEPEDIQYTRNRFAIAEKAMRKRISDLTAERDMWKDMAERHPYEQRIVGDGRDWGEIMRDAFDSLMSTACEACTEEQLSALAEYILGELNADSAPGNVVTAEQAGANDGNADLGTWESETSQLPEYAVPLDKLRNLLGAYYAQHDDERDELRAKYGDEIVEHSLESESDTESGCESDTREKLEADVLEWCDGDLYLNGAIREYLNRQETITEREYIGALNAAAGKWAKADAEVNEWRDNAKAERTARYELERKCRDLEYVNLEFRESLAELGIRHEQATAERDKLQVHCDNQRGELARLNDERNRLAYEASQLKRIAPQAQPTRRVRAWLDGCEYMATACQELDCIDADYRRVRDERDYWKAQVGCCLECACERYAPGVMHYPTGSGCAEPASLVTATIEGLREALADGTLVDDDGEVIG